MGCLKGQPDRRGYLVFLCSPVFSTLSWESSFKVGWAEPQVADLLGSGHCCFLSSLKQVCGIQGTSWPPTIFTPADASFPFEVVATYISLGCYRLLWWGRGLGVSPPLAAPPHLRSLSILSFPSSCPLPTGSCSIQPCWGEAHLLPEE